MSITLASASPRRAELLRNAGLPFTVEPAHVPEQGLPDEQPLIYAQRLARDKALAVFGRNPDSVVLGADTIVVVNEHLLEKPQNDADAARMLRLLSGRVHQVITGVCLIAKDYEQTEAEVTEVRFSALSVAEIAEHVATRALMDTRGGQPSRAQRSLLFQCSGASDAGGVPDVATTGDEDGDAPRLSEGQKHKRGVSVGGRLRVTFGGATFFFHSTPRFC